MNRAGGHLRAKCKCCFPPPPLPDRVLQVSAGVSYSNTNTQAVTSVSQVIWLLVLF